MDRKTIKIRITLCFVGIALFLGLGITIYTGLGFISTSLTGFHTEDAVQIDGSATFSADSVDAIHVNLLDGDLNIEYSDIDEIIVTQTGNKKKSALHTALVNGTLELYTTKNFFMGMSFGRKDGTISVTLPAEMAPDYKISLVSGEGNVQTHGDSIHIDSVSGSINLEGQYREISANTVSGAISMDNPAKTIEADTVSGAIYFAMSQELSQSVDLNTVSGKMVGTHDAVGYDLSFQSISGKFYDVIHVINGKANMDALVGDGQVALSANSVSASLSFQ